MLESLPKIRIVLLDPVLVIRGSYYCYIDSNFIQIMDFLSNCNQKAFIKALTPIFRIGLKLQTFFMPILYRLASAGINRNFAKF